MDEIRSKLSKGEVSAPRALNQLWTFVEDNSVYPKRTGSARPLVDAGNAGAARDMLRLRSNRWRVPLASRLELPGGFSIHAGVRIDGDDREGREQLCPKDRSGERACRACREPALELLGQSVQRARVDARLKRRTLRAAQAPPARS
jgi:hypothetical protein